MSATYAYDVNGNMTKRNTQAYVFDLGNRATQATGVSTYSYDGEGRRTKIVNTDGTLQYQVYDSAGQLMYAEAFTGSGSTLVSYTKYIYLGAKLIAEHDSVGGIEYSHTDALGSPVARTNASAGVISQTRFEPYGNVASGFVPTHPNSVGFTGHVNDSNTGLVYMQQRYYDPIAGRLMSVDPVVTDAAAGANFNRYEYSNSSPYKYIDPDGETSLVVQGGGGIFIGLGMEGYAGFYISGAPNWDIGLFGSGGLGGGLSVGLGLSGGFAKGSTSDLRGVTINTNVSTGILSASVAVNPDTGKVAEVTAGAGARLGVSETVAHTGVLSLRELLSAPKSDEQPAKPDQPATEPPVKTKDPAPNTKSSKSGGGFQGTFSVDGRIDAAQLAKKLSQTN